jgi:hypothetical protein
MYAVDTLSISDVFCFFEMELGEKLKERKMFRDADAFVCSDECEKSSDSGVRCIPVMFLLNHLKCTVNSAKVS